MIQLLSWLNGPWEKVRVYLQEDLDQLTLAVNKLIATSITTTSVIPTGTIPLTSLAPSTAPSTLIGRDSTGPGVWEQLSLGSGLSINGTVLAATGANISRESAIDEPDRFLFAKGTISLNDSFTGVLGTIYGGTGLSSYVLGDMLYASAANTLATLPGNTSSAVQFLSQTGTGSVSAAPVWMTVPSAGSLVFFFYNTASDIGTYFVMKTPASVGAAQTFVTLNVGNGTFTLQSFATLVGVPNLTFVPAGICTGYITARASAAGAQISKLFAEFYQRTSGGTETLLATSAQTISLTTVDAAYIFQGAIPSSVVFVASDRLVTKIRILRSGGGSPDITLTVEGTTAARSESPSATVDATNFVPYSGATANIDLGSKALTTTGLGTFGSLTVDSPTLFVDAVNHRVGVGTITPGSLFVLDKSAIAVTSTDGAVLQNITAATAGVTLQYSPRLRFRANVWNTGTLLTETNDWWFESQPIAGNPTRGQLKLFLSINGAAAGGSKITFASAGMIVDGFISTNSPGDISSGHDVIVASGRLLYWINGSTLDTPLSAQLRLRDYATNNFGVLLDFATDGTLKIRNRADSVDATVHANSYQIANAGGFGWDTRTQFGSPGDAKLQFFNNAFSAGVVLDVTTNGTLRIRNAADNADGNLITQQITQYKAVATVGWGVPAIYGTGRSPGAVAAVASVATYTVGAADGSFLICANVNVTAVVTASFTVNCVYTDETGASRTSVLTFSQITGTTLFTITAVTGTGAYEGVPLHIRCKASTSITLNTTGTFTSVTYNVEGFITQIG